MSGKNAAGLCLSTPPVLTNSAGAAQHSGRNELQRHAVVAIAQAGRPGAVVEHVALVAQALGAVVLGALLDDLEVGLLTQRATDLGVEAGPAGAAVELPFGLEQRQAAAEADEGPVPVLVVERAGEWRLRALLAQHLEGRR